MELSSVIAQYQWSIFAVVSALLAGLVPNFLKLGTQKIAPSFSAFIYSLLYSMFLALVLIIDKNEGLFSAFSTGAVIQLVTLGTIKAIEYLSYTTALSYGGIAKVVPLLLMRSILSNGIDLYLASKFPTKLQLCAMILIIFGIILLESGKNRNSRGIWVLFALIALACCILDDLLTKRVWMDTAVTTSSGMFIINLIAFALLLLIAILGRINRQPGTASLQNWIFLLLAGVASGLSVLLAGRAEIAGNVRYLQPLASLWFPVAMLGGRIIHKEEFPVGSLFGVLLIIVGNFLQMVA